MGRVYETLTPDLISWIECQHLFFAATPPGDGGHVNCSPKGLDTLRILDPVTVAYLDLTGSGVETIAHLRDNGRIVLMFCAFEGPPKILRIHGCGSVLQEGSSGFDDLLQHFMPLEPPLLASARSVIRIDVECIADSCGYGVPLMRYEGERRQLAEWTDKRLRKHGPEAIHQYRGEKNMTSVDDLPGLEHASPEQEAP
jgi:Pyridoxamine 5'-phosphate oxidase